MTHTSSREQRATCKPFAPSCHPERGNKAEPRDLDRANRARSRYEHAKLFLAKKLLCAIEVQRFYLDPATASPCGLLARQSLASQTSAPLRCAQDDTDGMLIADLGGTKAPSYHRVIPSEPIKASRGISTERRTRGRGMNTPNFFLRKCYFSCIELQRFYLDPASA